MNGATAGGGGGGVRGGAVPALNGSATATAVAAPPPPSVMSQTVAAAAAAASPNMLQCGGCQQPYSEPCLLDCFHTVCARCLRPLVDAANREVSCPFCG